MMHSDASSSNDAEHQSVSGSLNDAARGSGESSREAEEANLDMSEKLRESAGGDHNVIVEERDRSNTGNTDDKKVAPARGQLKAPPPSRSTESQSLPDSRRGGHIESLQKSRAQSRLYSQRNRDKQRRQIEELQGLQLELETERSSLIMLNRNYHERLLAAKAENEALLQLLNRRQQILYRAAEASASADRYRHVRSILNRPPSLMYPPFNNPLAQQSFHPMFGLSQPSMPPMGAYLPGGGGTSRMLQSPLGTNLPPPPSWPGPPGSFNPFPGQLSTTPLDMELIMRQQLLMQHQPPANPEMEEVLRRGRLDHWPERPIGDSSGSVWTTVERRRDRSDDLPSILDQASLLLHQQPPPQESDDESST